MTDGSDPNADNPWARLKPVLPETNQSHDEPGNPDPGAPDPEGLDNPEAPASSDASAVGQENPQASESLATEPTESEPPYSVGYRRPPLKSRFTKGCSGNRNGRPRRSKNFDTLLQLALDKVLKINDGGREIKLTTRDVIVKRIVNKAISGDLKAIDRLIKIMRETPAAEPFQIGPDDDAALRKYVDRISKNKDRKEDNEPEDDSI